MKPFILNAHMGENEDQILLFVSLTEFYLMPKRENSNVIIFSDELEKKGHQVIGFEPSKFFAGNDGIKDGGYAFTVVMKDQYKPEEELLKDVYLILNKLETV